MKTNKKLMYVGAISLVLFCIWFFYKPETDKTVKTEKKRTVTRIIERRDGTKETTVISDESKTDTSIKTKPKNWSVGVGQSLTEKTPIYIVNVNKRILGDLSLGAYGRTDGELGVMIIYSF